MVVLLHSSSTTIIDVSVKLYSSMCHCVSQCSHTVVMLVA